jgi:hypothetical protein
MRKKILFTAFMLLSMHSFSQEVVDTSWKSGGVINLNFSQVNLSQWAQGGENSISLGSLLLAFANYEKDKIAWSNSLKLSYAFIKSGDQHLRKNDDQIDLTSKLSRKFAEKWYYSVLFNFKSQFAKGYLYPNDSVFVSTFLAPGYVTLALGVNFKPVDYFEVFLSPITAKYTLVNDQRLADAGAYGVHPGDKTRTEIGAYMNIRFKKDIMQNVTLLSKVELFNNYSDDDHSNRGNIDVFWDAGLVMKVNKWLNATITTQLIYDDDIIQRTQFKESLGIGLGYNF